MRRAWPWLLGCALLVGGSAEAQFANHSLGISSGYFKINNFDRLNSLSSAVSWAVPVGLEGSVYVENGFDLLFHGYAMVFGDPILNKQYMGFFASGGVRYLFLQETWRPYVGLELGYFQTFGTPNDVPAVGLCPAAGVDYFVTDTTSLGVRGQFGAYWWLNAKGVATSFAASALVSLWF